MPQKPTTSRTLIALAVVLGFTSSAWSQTVTQSVRNSGYQLRNVKYGRVSALGNPTLCEDHPSMTLEASPSPSDVSPSPSDVSPSPSDVAPQPDLAADLGGDVASSSSFGASSGGYSASPAMIGDFFGGGNSVVIPIPDFPMDPPIQVVAPIAGGDRRMKIAENTSPIPTDRLFFNYHHFANPLQTAAGRELDLDRYVFGIEKTCLSGNASVELRIPFASGLSAIQAQNPENRGDNEGVEFGNIGFVFKGLLFADENHALATGVSLNTPTARDAKFFSTPDTLQFVVRNESFHIQPFIGYLITPTANTWVLFFGQLDFDANGNTVEIVDGDTGVIQDQNLLYLDMSVGHWLYRDPNQSGLVPAVAGIFELHYTTTLQDADGMFVPDGAFTNPLNRMDILNVTGALRIHLGTNSILTIGGVGPLREGGEKLFDGELAVQYTRLY